MKKYLYITALAFAFILGKADVTYAQAGLKKSNQEFNEWAYIESATIFEKVLKRGYESQDLLEKLGDAYYYNSRYKEANKHYTTLFEKYNKEEISAEYYYRYSQTLLHVGEETSSQSYYNEFANKVGSQSQVVKFRENEEDLRKQISENSGRYSSFDNLPINTSLSEFGSFVKDRTLYFTSARDTGSLSKKVHTWTDNAFTRIYQYPLDKDPINKNITSIKGGINSKLNESTAVITKDGKTMYFTRNNILKNKRGYDTNGNTNLKIYQATLINNSWTNIEELPFNGDSFNTAHPVLSADDKLMYFVSDRSGGYGNSDVYRIARHDNGTFGGPENLGPTINTEARETFPFVTENDELYFSSDGRVGLGGLDVYAVKTYHDGTLSEVQNVGEPINSNADDFAYFIDKSTKEGYVSSNRTGGKGNDDIYSFTESRPLQLECSQKLLVTVRDKKTNALINDAKLSLFDFVYNPISQNSKFINDAYQFNDEIRCNQTVRVKASKDGYLTSETEVTIGNKTGVTNVTMYLEPEKVVVKKGDDLFKVLNLNPIYFDLNKYNIREDAALELAKVLAVLEDNPTMKIDIRSHTDSRASHKYNDKLSDGRAKATREWLISNGISASRLTAKGYGERQLINDCADGVKCSEEEHQENRRSEFIILEM